MGGFHGLSMKKIGSKNQFAPVFTATVNFLLFLSSPWPLPTNIVTAGLTTILFTTSNRPTTSRSGCTNSLSSANSSSSFIGG
jgi:hypothetical protein